MKNSYLNLDLEKVKVELERNISYLAAIDIENLDDDIEWETDAYRVTPIPRIIATIEQKLSSFHSLIKDCISQLEVITKIEASVSDFVIHCLDVLEDRLNSLMGYFENRPPESITVRTHFIDVTTAKGKTVTITKIAANIPKQIENKVSIQNKVLKLLPIINMLREDRKKEILVKGGKDIPASLIGRI